MFTFSQVLLRMGGYTKIAEMLFDVQPLPSPNFPLDFNFPPELPSQQIKQNGAGELGNDVRVDAPNG